MILVEDEEASTNNHMGLAGGNLIRYATEMSCKLEMFVRKLSQQNYEGDICRKLG